MSIHIAVELDFPPKSQGEFFLALANRVLIDAANGEESNQGRHGEIPSGEPTMRVAERGQERSWTIYPHYTSRPQLDQRNSLNSRFVYLDKGDQRVTIPAPQSPRANG
jgi:hypothetical protein